MLSGRLSYVIPLGCLAIAICWPAASRADDGYRNDPFKVRHAPQVHHYDAAQDKFYHLKSVLTPAPSDQPQNALGRYGNRLTQFRYFGPVKGAGIYGAMDRYKASLNLDASRYKYRMER
ncbi:MAG: hypothetical protein AB7O62_23030 [Pirellulales bacterium]